MKRKGSFLKGVAGAMALCLAFAFPTPVSAEETDATLVSSKQSGTVIFQDGKTNESYESDNGDWLLKAADDDVITVVYSCTDKDHAGWGVLGWGATVDDAWKDGPSLSASETNATDTMVASMTVADFKKTMGITGSSVITCLKLGAWNGGKIESITVSAKGEAPKVEGAEEIVLEAPKDLEGEYLYLLTEPTTIGIYPNDYCLGANPGITIYLTIEMESNGPFGGGIGICVNEWLWYQKEYSSDDSNKCTLELFITPLQNCFQFQVWWMGGTQLGIKSITVEKAVDYRVPATVVPEVKPGYEGNANASHHGYVDFADSSWWTEREITLAELIGDVDPATVTSIVFNGNTSFTIGYNSATAWVQNDAKTHTATDILFSSNGTKDYKLKACLSKGDGVEYRITWDVYTNGATPAGDSSTGGGTTPTAPAKYTHTFTTKSDVSFNLNDYVSDLAIGDQVKMTISAKGDSSKDWYGYSMSIGANSGADSESAVWTQTSFQTYSKEDLTDSLTITVPYNSNDVMIGCWDIQGSDIEVEVTFEKL